MITVNIPVVEKVKLDSVNKAFSSQGKFPVNSSYLFSLSSCYFFSKLTVHSKRSEPHYLIETKEHPILTRKEQSAMRKMFESLGGERSLFYLGIEVLFSEKRGKAS